VPARIQDAPIVAHRKAGVECEGVILPEPDDEQVVLKSNVCGAVGVRLPWERAITSNSSLVVEDA
jgi:hypothetical protein